MRPSFTAAVGAAAAAVLVVAGLAGCDSSTSSDRGKPSSSSKHPAAQLELGNSINYGSFGTTSEVNCADGKSLNVGGSNNTLTVRGTCQSVNVVGADNRLTVERIDRALTITGLNNTVTYRRGDPSVNDHGTGNTVHKR